MALIWSGGQQFYRPDFPPSRVQRFPPRGILAAIGVGLLIWIAVGAWLFAWAAAHGWRP